LLTQAVKLVLIGPLLLWQQKPELERRLAIESLVACHEGTQIQVDGIPAKRVGPRESRKRDHLHFRRYLKPRTPANGQGNCNRVDVLVQASNRRCAAVGPKSTS
jgi:hypothetical protein